MPALCAENKLSAFEVADLASNRTAVSILG